MKTVMIYTDGACSCNPGPGGWAAILIYGEKKKEICGGETETTNNRMEMLAVINGLKALKVKCKANVYSDSAYVVNSITNGWIYGWAKNGWKKADNKPVKNRELWEELLSLLKKHEVEFFKVKGHADDELNNRCDFLARAEAEKVKGES